MQVNWTIIDKVIYINPEERQDKRNSIERELQELNIPEKKIHRLNATKHLLGYISCAQSHLMAIDTAIANKWQNVLILEDDMVFTKDPQSIAHLNYFLDALSHIKWDIALLSANYHQVIALKSTTAIVKPLIAHCACAYLVNKHYLKTIRNNFAFSVTSLLQGGYANNYALDITWQVLMQKDYWLGMYPVAGYQQPGPSDIEDSFINYKELFYKNLAEISI